MIGISKTIGLLLLSAASALQAQSPEISRISPMAARPGETVTVTLEGKNLLQPQQIWTSFGATTEWAAEKPGKDGKAAKPDGKKLVGKLTLAAEAPLGLGFLRLPTATGFSGPLYFLVEEMPVVMKCAKNESAAKAQPVSAPAAIEGDAKAAQSDFYTVEMKAGESVSIEAFAARIGSKMDPVLRLLDAAGNELAAVDDTRGLAGDCRLRYSAKGDGPLVIEIRDASFKGGPEYFYHLRIGDFPLVSSVFPPLAAPGQTVEATAMGEGVDGVAPMRVTAQRQATGVEPVAVRFGAGKPAAFGYVRTEEPPIYLVKELPETALEIDRAATVLGRLGEAERNSFLIAMKKDDELTLTPLTREIGSPAVLYLGVEDAKGKLIASNDTAGAAASTEMALTFRAPADGAGRLSIEEIGHRGGSDLVYALRIERRAKELALTLSADRFVAPRGGSFSTKVTAQRRGVSGEISLELVSGDGRALPTGFRCEHNVIEKGKNETELKIVAPADVPVGTVCHVRIIGHATEAGRQIEAVATPPKVDLVKKAPKEHAIAAMYAMPQPPRLLAETIPICVGPDAPDFFAIEVTGGEVVLPTIVGKGAFVVRQKSLDPAFTGDSQLKFEGLPPGFAITSGNGRGGRIDGQVDFICEVTGPVDAAPGALAFDIVASGELKGAQKEVRLAKVPLRVVKPLGIAGAVASPIAPGGKQKLKITAANYDAEDPQPIEVTLRDFPPGITGPEKVTIAPGETETVVELAAGGDAAEGRFDRLVLGAASRVKGIAVAVESLPIHLEVTK